MKGIDLFSGGGCGSAGARHGRAQSRQRLPARCIDSRRREILKFRFADVSNQLLFRRHIARYSTLIFAVLMTFANFRTSELMNAANWSAS